MNNFQCTPRRLPLLLFYGPPLANRSRVAGSPHPTSVDQHADTMVSLLRWRFASCVSLPWHRDSPLPFVDCEL